MDETKDLIVILSVLLLLYGFYAFTWILKTYYLYKKWGIPIHRFGYIFLFLAIVSALIIVLPDDLGWIENRSLMGGLYLFAFLFLPPIYYYFLSRDFWKPKQQTGERKMKSVWSIIQILSSLGLLLVFGFLTIKFIYASYHYGFSAAFSGIKDIFYIGLFFSLIQGLYEGYDKSFKDSIVDIESFKSRDYVLVIRSFASDARPFIWGLTQFFYSDKNGNKKLKQLPSPTVFEYLHLSFEKEIGELLVIGDPIRYLPIGSVKNAYHSNDTWQKYFLEWAKNAKAIITIPDNTEGLDFEIQTIVEQQLLHKFFIAIGRENSTSRIGQMRLKYLRYIRNHSEVDWTTYCKNLNFHGLSIEDRQYGNGTLIGFDDNGQSRILGEQLSSPDTFVQSIQKMI